MFPLLGLCGVSTFIFGAMTGGFFGDFLPQLAQIIDPNTTFTALPALFSPLDDTLMILVGSMCLGLVQIVTGMAITSCRKIKRGDVMAALVRGLRGTLVYSGRRPDRAGRRALSA